MCVLGRAHKRGEQRQQQPHKLPATLQRGARAHLQQERQHLGVSLQQLLCQLLVVAERCAQHGRRTRLQLRRLPRVQQRHQRLQAAQHTQVCRAQ